MPLSLVLQSSGFEDTDFQVQETALDYRLLVQR